MGRQSLYQFKKGSILRAIQSLSEDGRSPAMREIAETTDVPLSTLHSYLERLQSEGLVTWEERSHRSLRLTERAHSLLGSRNPGTSSTSVSSSQNPQPPKQGPA